MNIHILGICGKFMSGVAIIARQMGFEVSGSDINLALPVAKTLQSLGISLSLGYGADTLPKDIAEVVIGNALSRGQPVIERILNENIPFSSGPSWLAQHVLKDRWVLVITGTHGKTTTSSMVAWILEVGGLNPGFLIGGDPLNFKACARYTDSSFFVIEGDEYDTAFFDKRSKFIHYVPKTLIINNLEFDHADIFETLEDIKKQFKHLLAILPGQGMVITPSHDMNVQSLLQSTKLYPIERFGLDNADWIAENSTADGSSFEISLRGQKQGQIKWNLVGQHNVFNALAALAAARHAGVPANIGIEALNQFKGVKRRLELRGSKRNIKIYDDFAHHPTAIETTLSALRKRVGNEKIFAVIEFGSNTMKAGFHLETLPKAFTAADDVVLLRPKNINWQVEELVAHFTQPVQLFDSVDQIVTYLIHACQEGDNILCMSNQQFDGIYEKLLGKL